MIIIHSDIRAGEELTLCYEAPVQTEQEVSGLMQETMIVRINEKIGGAYKVGDCRCGSRVCCADIMRRLLSGRATEHDKYFLLAEPYEGTDYMWIDLNKVIQVNKYLHDSCDLGDGFDLSAALEGMSVDDTVMEMNAQRLMESAIACDRVGMSLYRKEFMK